MIERVIATAIRSHEKHYPVLALVGPRQSGKTTLAKTLFAHKPYVNLEDLEMRDFAKRDPKGFMKTYENGAVIDEVQRVPDLLSYIQVAVDERKENGRYILTGSQNFLLMEGMSQSLAGRVSIFTLLPFSLAELHDTTLFGKQQLRDVLFRGTYPKLHDDVDVDARNYYANYTQTYIERDVRLIRNIPDLATFRSFLLLCAARTGQLLNVASLANDAGISHATAKQWLSVLEMSYVLFLLRPHHVNYGKRVVKMPKLYFYDTGLLCHLLDISTPSQVNSHYLIGSIFESLIVSECVKYRYNHALEPNVSFWRDKRGNEVDLLLEDADTVVPVEIKTGATISQDYFKGIAYYTQLAGRDVCEARVVYGGTQNQHRSEGHVVGWRHLSNELPFRRQ